VKHALLLKDCHRGSGRRGKISQGAPALAYGAARIVAIVCHRLLHRNLCSSGFYSRTELFRDRPRFLGDVPAVRLGVFLG